MVKRIITIALILVSILFGFDITDSQEAALVKSDIDQSDYDELMAKIEQKDKQIYNLTTIVIIVTLLFSLMIIVVLYYRYNTLKAIDRKIEELSHEDLLTKLMNRRAMLEALELEAARSRRSKNNFSIILADVDDFAKINAAFGSSCGDAAIADIAETFSSSLRDQDRVARWSGTEFLILLPETDDQGALIVAESLKKKVEEKTISCNAERIPATLSFGLSTFDRSCSLDVCRALADTALIEAKNAGKDCIRQKITVKH
jgi:diguanylate cyclase (GGDEF)-like protein